MTQIGETLDIRDVKDNTEGRQFMVETARIIQMRQETLSQEQTELVIGSLLGDGYLVRTTKGFAFRVNHGLKQKEYVDWKFNILRNLVNSAPKSSGSCYYFRTVSHPYFEFLRQKFYPDGKRMLPVDLVEANFTPFLVAVWIMDDGTKCGNQLRINSHCFSREENVQLQRFLSAKLGIKSVLNKDKNMVRIRIVNESMPNLIVQVKPYIIPSMLYKLPL